MPLPDPPPITTAQLLTEAYTALRKIMTGAVASYSIGSIHYTRHNIDDLLNLIKWLEGKKADEDSRLSGGPFMHSQAVFGGRR